jgi:hypothetical protein
MNFRFQATARRLLLGRKAMRLSELTSFLFYPPLRLFHMATGFWVSQTLFAATELEVFALLEQRPLTVEEFCQRLGIEQRAGQGLLGALVSLGWCVSETDVTRTHRSLLDGW